MSSTTEAHETTPLTDIFDTKDDQNIPIGNNEKWGDDIKEKNERTLRLYFQNINGLSTAELTEDWMDIYTIMEDHNVDIYGLAETNITWTPTVTHNLHSKLRLYNGGGSNQIKMSQSSCDDPTLSTYQPGGVCQVARNKVVGRIGKYGNDPHSLGRWAYMTIQGRKGVKVVVATVYRLSQSSKPDGYRTAYNQQYRHLRRQGIQNPEPKSQLCKDLLIQVNIWKKDSEVIIMIDANDDMDNTEWANFVTRAELYDVMGMKHGHNSPSTYIKGTKTIDYILATSKVAESVTACGMFPYQTGIVTDHRGLWIDMDIPQLLKGGISPIHENLQQRPKCKQKERCKKLD